MYDFEIPDFERDLGFRNEKTRRKTMRTTLKKCIREKPEKRTIRDRLTDLYLEYAGKGSVEEGPFIKCNFLEELVIRENLKFISLSIYPNKNYLFSLKEFFDDSPTSSTSLKEEDIKVFGDSIDLEEIPAYLFYVTMRNSSMFYDRHLILQITKFATDTENDRPIFSMFLLLKPTDSICREWIRHEIAKELGELKEREAENIGGTPVNISVPVTGKVKQNDCNSDAFNACIAKEEKLKYKTAIFELAGPLYLDLRSDKTSQLVFLLEFYSSPFASYSIKHLFNKKEENMPPFQFYPDRKLTESEKDAFFEHIDSFTVLPQPIHNSKNRLNSFLRKREIIIEDSDDSDSSPIDSEITVMKKNSRSNCILVESFKFITKMGETGETKTTELNVYFKKYEFHVELNCENYLYSSILDKNLAERVGDRVKLDKYIFSFAELESEKFMQSMTIRHANMTNMTDNKFKTIFSCRCLEDMEKNYSVPFITPEEQMEKMDITGERDIKQMQDNISTDMMNIPREIHGISNVYERFPHSSATTKGISQMQLGRHLEQLRVTENPEIQRLGQDETQMEIDDQAIKDSSSKKIPGKQARGHKKVRILYAQSGGSES